MRHSGFGGLVYDMFRWVVTVIGALYRTSIYLIEAL